jgi:hypothetical protein
VEAAVRGALLLALALLLAGCAKAARSRELAERPASAPGWTSAPWAASDPVDGSLRISASERAPAAGEAVQRDVLGRAIPLTAGRREVERVLALDGLRGWEVEVTARLRWAGIPRPAVPWEGVRLGLWFTTPIKAYGSGAHGRWGDGGWSEVSFRARIPADAGSAAIRLGLIADAGTLWVDQVRLERRSPPLADGVDPGWAPPPARWRGTGVGGTAAAGGASGRIAPLAREWGANLCKVWLPLPDPALADGVFRAELDRSLAGVTSALDEAAAAGVAVIVQTTAGPAWRDPARGGTHRMYLDPAVADRFIESWRIIARRLAGRPALWGCDLLNETVLKMPPTDGCGGWEELAGRAAQVVNDLLPEARVLVQPEEWWGMRAFERLRPVEGRNLVYSVHMYEPFALTHQGVKTRRSEGLSYPGTIDGVRWDRGRLREALRPAREFQLAHRVPMQVGEFSCIRWAPDGSAGRWLADCIALFEEYGWDWTYHAAGDWDGWSVELGGDPDDRRPLPAPGSAKRALLEGMARNRR